MHSEIHISLKLCNSVEGNRLWFKTTEHSDSGS